MKFAIFRTSSFKKAYKKLTSSDQELVLTIVLKLAQGESLDEKYKDHLLIGNYKGCTGSVTLNPTYYSSTKSITMQWS